MSMMLKRPTLVLAFGIFTGCTHQVDAFSAGATDRSVSVSSACPTAVHAAKVGTYKGAAKSGAGYFYDEVLEYRVWLHPDLGAEPLAGDKDYFAAFAQYEPALAFSQRHKGAEAPFVLVRQTESIDEPGTGVFEWDKSERVTEWQVQWLQGSHREHNSIANFLAAHQALRP